MQREPYKALKISCFTYSTLNFSPNPRQTLTFSPSLYFCLFWPYGLNHTVCSLSKRLLPRSNISYFSRRRFFRSPRLFIAWSLTSFAGSIVFRYLNVPQLIRRRTSWLLPMFDGDERSCYKTSQVGFHMAVSFHFVWVNIRSMIAGSDGKSAFSFVRAMSVIWRLKIHLSAGGEKAPGKASLQTNWIQQNRCHHSRQEMMTGDQAGNRREPASEN